MTVVVAQLGARMHYAVPSILARANMLERLYTDTYAPQALRSILAGVSNLGPAFFRRWLGRIPTDIPEERIVSFSGFGFEYYWRRRHAGGPHSATAAYLWAGHEFCRRIIKRGLGSANCVYTFNSAGLELLKYARTQGAFAVMEQTIAPAGIEDDLLQTEEANYPQWTTAHSSDLLRRTLAEREQMEWQAADLIFCGSEFVRDGIRASGGPADRCRVVPYGIRAPAQVAAKNFCHKPLRVLTVGAVGLRKGAPYVYAAARSLKDKAEFRMAGTIEITPHAQNLLTAHVKLLGVVPRSEIHQQFAWADVFLLPSICEGSATVCYEALAFGLPVIATQNAGSVVRDGVDGYIVPVRDPEAIVDRIERFADSSDLLAIMSQNALERAKEYTLERYGERLLSELSVAEANA